VFLLNLKKFLLIVLFLSIFILSGCNFTTKSKLKEDFGLSTVKDANDLKKLMSGKGGYFDRYYSSPSAEDSANDDSPQPSVGSGSDDYTKTNVQVEGVDEGDIVKTDGNRIYSVKYDRLKVVGILDNGQMELLLNDQIISDGDIDPNNFRNTYYQELYLTDKYLIVIGHRYQYGIYIDGMTTDDAIEPGYSSYYSTAMSVVCLYDIDTLDKVDEYQISGNLLGSRLIENKLYLISNHYAYNYIDNEDYDPRPFITHNGETDYVEYNDIKYTEDVPHQSFTVITTVTLNDDVEYDNDIFLGVSSWGQLYVSKNAIYFASVFYDINIFGNYQQNGKLISYQFENCNTSSYYINLYYHCSNRYD